jgi:PAS domain S-box-containing protein
MSIMKGKANIEALLQEVETLRKRVTDLEANESAYSHFERKIDKKTEALERHIREMNCLYEVSRLAVERDESLDQIIHRVARALSSFLGHYTDRQVRIILDNQVFDSETPPRAAARMNFDIKVHGMQVGVLEVYHDNYPPETRERQLITDVVVLLARIIEQKQTEKTLLENERSFRTLVEDSPTGIFIVQKGKIVYENPEEKRLSGPLAQLFRSGDLSNIHPEDIVNVKDGFKKIMLGEIRTLDIEFRFFVCESVDAASEIKWVHCRASLINYMGDEAILVNKLDVTRTKELEFLLRTEDKMASLGRVASGMAHEIRNPLSGINIYLSNLEKIVDDRESTKKAKEIIGELQAASNRIESVIKRVMDFSKPSEPRFIRINVNQPILNAINFSSVTIRKAGIALNTSLADDLPLCDADPHLMEQVILNLITNAKEAMKNIIGPKKINVTTSVQNDHIVVTVSDSGPGVPLSMRKRIFDPFYTTKDGNTGIGLSLCYRIVVDHKGSLTVADNDQGGAEFRIELPLKSGKGIPST